MRQDSESVINSGVVSFISYFWAFSILSVLLLNLYNDQRESTMETAAKYQYDQDWADTSTVRHADG
jgi:uncharacterized membrane protein